jgi:hypothetical protein
MSNFLNYKNDYGINPFNDLDEWYIDATFEELRLGLIPFDLSNRLKEMFARIQTDIQTINTKLPQYTTALRPPYVKGSLIFDSTLNKLVVGGATDWEVITST